MGVRVRIRIKANGKQIDTAALVNSGYESEDPEIHIPLALAKRLGFSLEKLSSEKYRVVGSDVHAYILGNVEVRIVVEDKETPWVKARAVMVPGEYEVLLGDAITEKLGIEIIRPKTGHWRLRGEEKVRSSVEPEYWVE